MPNDKEDIRIAKKYFNFKCVEARSFGKKTVGKNPDLELFFNNEKFAICEVKAIRNQSFNPGPSGIYILNGRPPIYNKLESKIRESSKQFQGVNPNHGIPNVILLINYHRYDSAGELADLLNGRDGGNNLKRLNPAGSLDNIDLIIWIDKKDQIERPFHILSNPDLIKMFGNNIEKQIPANIFSP